MNSGTPRKSPRTTDRGVSGFRSQRVLSDVLSESARDGFSVAEAVRLSMNIPLFFQPGRLAGGKIRNHVTHGPALTPF